MTRLVKCVVWDIDHTLLEGVYLESAEEPPGAVPAARALLAELAGRGILHAIASKNPPQAAAHAAAVTGCEFVAAECGWDAKSQALARIATSLGIGTDALAFVDDDPYERAEVAAALPEVLVLSPEEAAQAAGWPALRPPVVTAEARRRAELYAARRRRAEAERGFTGSREEFRRSVGTEVTIAPAVPADLPRLAELALRTRQFNSATAAPGQAEFAALIGAPGTDVITVRLRDAFGDDGLVGAAVVDHEAGGGWTVRLLMMSCRAMGRGVIDALLAWLARAACQAGAGPLAVRCLLTERNVPLRLALAAAGFRATAPPAAAGSRDGPKADGAAGAGDGTSTGTAPLLFRRDPAAPPPEVPGWVRSP